MSEIVPSNGLLICIPVDNGNDTLLLGHDNLFEVYNAIDRILRFPLKCDDVRLMSLVAYLAQLISLIIVEYGGVQ